MMKNVFTVTSPNEDLFISIQWEDSLDAISKLKIKQLVLSALEIWDIQKEEKTQLTNG